MKKNGDQHLPSATYTTTSRMSGWVGVAGSSMKKSRARCRLRPAQSRTRSIVCSTRAIDSADVGGAVAE